MYPKCTCTQRRMKIIRLITRHVAGLTLGLIGLDKMPPPPPMCAIISIPLSSTNSTHMSTAAQMRGVCAGIVRGLCRSERQFHEDASPAPTSRRPLMWVTCPSVVAPPRCHDAPPRSSASDAEARRAVVAGLGRSGMRALRAAHPTGGSRRRPWRRLVRERVAHRGGDVDAARLDVALTLLAEQRGWFREIQVGSDGNCLFEAIAAAMACVERGHPPAATERRRRAAELRHAAVDFLCPGGGEASQQPIEDGSPLRICDLLDLDVGESSAEYGARMRTDRTWGGAAEIYALSQVLQRRIVVYGAGPAQPLPHIAHHKVRSLVEIQAYGDIDDANMLCVLYDSHHYTAVATIS